MIVPCETKTNQTVLGLFDIRSELTLTISTTTNDHSMRVGPTKTNYWSPKNRLVIYPLGQLPHPQVISSTPKYIIEIDIFVIYLRFGVYPTMGPWLQHKSCNTEESYMETAETTSSAKIVKNNKPGRMADSNAMIKDL